MTRPRVARAFTVLELVLALAVASLVMLAAIASIAGVQRADERLTIRAEEQAGLGRAQIIARRALTSLALSDERGDIPDTGVTDAETREDFRFGLMPRVALEADPLVPGGQRLMLAVHRPPVDEGLARALYTSSETLDRLAAIEAIGSTANPEFSMGAFVVRPEMRDDLDIFGPDAPEITYTLWWVPDLDALEIYPPPPTPEVDEDLLDIPIPENERRAVDGDTDGDGFADTGNAIDAIAPPAPTRPAQPGRTTMALRDPALAGGTPICRGLVDCRWRFYHRRNFKQRMLIARSEDLPAFVELEVETATGVYASWLFEIDYISVGDEAIPDEPRDDEDENNEAGEREDNDADNTLPEGPGDDDDPSGGPA